MELGCILLSLSLGASAIIVQTVLLRELLVVFCGTEISIGIIFAAWMLWSAIGSWLGGVVRGSVRAIAVLVLLLAAVTPVTLHFVRVSREIVGATGVQYLSLPQIMLVVLITLCPACILAGMRFPIAVKLWSSIARSKERKSEEQKSGPGVEAVPGRVYALEALGSLAGGLAVSFLLFPGLDSLQNMFIAVAVGVAPLVALSTGVGRRPKHETRNTKLGAAPPPPSRVRPLVLGLALCGAFAAAVVFLAGWLDRESAAGQWRSFNPDLRLIERRESRYQNIAVLEYGGQRSIYGSGRLLFSVVDERQLDVEKEEGGNAAFAHLVMTQHKNPQSVLMIGGGATGILREVLKHPVTSVDYVEFDAMLLDATMRWLPGPDRAALGDARVHIHEVDGRRFVGLAKPESCDLVISMLSDPTTLGMNRLFTREFFELARGALKGDGVFVTMMSSVPNPRGVVLDANAAIYHTLRAVFAHVVFLPGGDTGVFFASNSAEQILRTPEALYERYNSRAVDAAGFKPEVFYLMVEENNLLWANFLLNRHGRLQTESGRARESGSGASAADQTSEDVTPLTVSELPLGGGEVVESRGVDEARYVNTDANPIAVVYSLLVWARFANPDKRDILDWLREVRFWWVWPALGAFVAAAAILAAVGRMARGSCGRLFRKIGLLSLAASCGFSGIAVQLILLLVFQNVVGHVYGLIGALVAAFMAGLALGARVAERRKPRGLPARLSQSPSCPDRRDRADRTAVIRVIVSRLMLVALAYLLLLAVVVPGGESVAGSYGGIIFFVCNAAAGFLTGICFPMFMVLWRTAAGDSGVRAVSCSASGGEAEGSAAGWLYGADLMGACVGSLAIGAVIVPVLGLTAACHIVCLVSLAGLVSFGLLGGLGT